VEGIFQHPDFLDAVERMKRRAWLSAASNCRGDQRGI
jgi:hypothetical protein